MYCMKLFPLTLLAFAALLALCAPAGAASPHARGASASLGDPDFGPALDGDHVYWVRETKHGDHTDARLKRKTISTGAVKLIARTRGERIDALFANGGKVAWSTIADDRPDGAKSWTMATMIHGMPHTATRSKVIASGHARFRVKGRGKAANTEACGTVVGLLSLSAKQELLYNAETSGCRGHKDVARGEIYDLVSGRRFGVPPLGAALFASVQSDRLINASRNDILVTTLASGAVTRYKSLGIPDQAIVNNAGDLVVAGDARTGGRVVSRITFFRAGSTTPAAVIDEPWLDSPSVLFCAGGVAEISEPGERMRIALRSLDGSLHEQFVGPRVGLGYDAKCVGNKVTLAAIANKGDPQVFSYEF